VITRVIVLAWRHPNSEAHLPQQHGPPVIASNLGSRCDNRCQQPTRPHECSRPLQASGQGNPVLVPQGVNAVETHRITWPQMGVFIRREVGELLDAGQRVAAQEPLQLLEEGVAYRVQDYWEVVDRLAA